MFEDSLCGKASFTDLATSFLLDTIAVSRNFSICYNLLFCAGRFLFCETPVDELANQYNKVVSPSVVI